MRIAITNDDSHRSPLLKPLVKFLEKWGEVFLVVTQHEKSWSSKSITPFTDIDVHKVTIHGRPAFTVNGTPADCANLAIYDLLPAKPDLVISGINVGLNAGKSFMFSSGTVGACLEANIAGIPGIAISQMLSPECRAHYLETYEIPRETLERFDAQYEIVFDELFSIFFEKKREVFFSLPITWNVNVPWSLAENPKITLASLSSVSYSSLFKRVEVPDVTGDSSWSYVHKPKIIESRDPLEVSDVRLLEDGIPTVTPLDSDIFGNLEPKMPPRWKEVATGFHQKKARDFSLF